MLNNIKDFPITHKWAPINENNIQLYSMGTPNGVKVALALEEMQLAYDAHLIDIIRGDQQDPLFLSLNPNNKIPAIIDPNGPNGKPIGLFESGAILIYLAEKTEKFLSNDKRKRYKTLQWLLWQMGGLGPMFGQFGFFYKFGGRDIEDKLPLERYLNETKRLLKVLDDAYAGKEWIVDNEYSIADMAILPWVNSLDLGYNASEITELNKYSNIMRILSKWRSRNATTKALNVTLRSINY